MFIKLPSGRIFKIENIVCVCWSTDMDELKVFTVGDPDAWTLSDDDAKQLYEYLESVSMVPIS